ncbi:MAG: metal ABC transporter solute-binding protein, Zn/Mn family [Pseudonocardiaceae bacterium]
MAFHIRWSAVSAIAVTMLFGIAACGATDQQSGGNERLTVVASTDVWASVARAVAGDAAEVKSIINDPSADPHAYESKPADAVDVTNADLVVFNGGGYDEFMPEILQSVGDKATIEAFALTEKPADGSPVNEHVWYALPVVREVAQRIAEELGQLDPAQASRFTARAQTFATELDSLNNELSDIARSHSGQQVAMTEPVAEYLITAAGLTDATPPEFLEAVEEETDPPAAAVAATEELFVQRQVQALVYNPQAETPVTSQIRAASEAAQIPVVTMTETLPENTDYQGWMSAQIDALSTALRG